MLADGRHLNEYGHSVLVEGIIAMLQAQPQYAPVRVGILTSAIDAPQWDEALHILDEQDQKRSTDRGARGKGGAIATASAAETATGAAEPEQSDGDSWEAEV